MNIVMLKLLAVHSKFLSRQLHYILEVLTLPTMGLLELTLLNDEEVILTL